jgi:DNA-binding NarL/FixJ family response regulator
LSTDVIEAVGILAVTVGEMERGVRLLSASGAQRDRLGLRYRVKETQVALEQAVAAARFALGDEAFHLAWAAGRSLTPGQAIAAALDPFTPAAGPPGTSLTPREVEILHLLASGQTDPAIAAALFISVRTVENHVSHILAKLGVHTRTAAVSASITAGHVTPSFSPLP